MVAPHRQHERVFEKQRASETLPDLVKGSDREIELAAIQQGRQVAQTAWP
jgi:hypothetical protein